MSGGWNCSCGYLRGCGKGLGDRAASAAARDDSVLPLPPQRCHYCTSDLKCSLYGGGKQGYYADCYYYSHYNNKGFNFNCPLGSGGYLNCPWGKLEHSLNQCAYSYTYNILHSWRPYY